MAEFVLNITDDYDPIYFECDSRYIAWQEVTKFFVQFVYLVPGEIINILIIYNIWIKNRQTYASSSYFIIFSMDCVIGAIEIFCDIITRFFMYFTPACPYLAPFFYEPLVFFKGMLIVMNHCKQSKFVIQSFLVFNRMTCVIYPNSYTGMWRKSLKFVIPFIILIPLSAGWNLAISRAYMIPTFGGFFMEYIKKVKWAGMSRFTFIFVSIALFFTVICTSVTLYSLIMLPNRLIKFERLITIASVYISIGYITFAIIQFIYAYVPSWASADWLFGLSRLNIDVMTVGTPIIMLCVSGKLREHVFNLKPKEIDRVFVAFLINERNAIVRTVRVGTLSACPGNNAATIKN